MIRYRLLGLAVIFLLMATLACGGGGEDTPAPTEPPAPTKAPPMDEPEPVEEMATLILENDSGETICYVLISPDKDDSWGEDWLGDAETIDSGDTHTFEMSVGIYDLQALNCDQDALDEQREQDLDGTVTWTISEGASPDSGGGNLDTSLDPAFGTVDLEEGFLPDPRTIDLISGGAVDVGTLSLGTDCGGYAANAPDLRMNLADSSDALRVFFVADEGEDATLIINDPAGDWYCNDDFTGWDPMIELADATSGQYDIWVGSYSADEYIGGTMYITEMDYDPGNLPEGASSGSGDSLNIASDPAFGSAELEAGFTPDPHEMALISGGSVDVVSLELGSDCGGYAASAPDYRISLAEDSDNLRIFFVAAEEDDATLIVNDPYGSWYCNDDFTGFDPMVELENATSGQYDIWVGSYSVDEYIEGTLYITEMDYDPDNLP